MISYLNLFKKLARARKEPIKVSVIIPAYNEASSIGDVIDSIRKVSGNFEIIVVDDGSIDNTYKAAMEKQVRVVRHPYNIGNGAAVKAGARASTGDYLVFMDADFQHNPHDIPKLLEGLDQYDMVVGSRSSRGNLSLKRTFLNSILNWVASVLAGHKILDLTSGFRAIKKERMMEFLHLLPNTFSYPSTLTLALFKAGYSVKYEQLSTIQRRKSGKSKIKLTSDGMLFLCIVAKIILLFDPLRFFLPASFILFIAGSSLAVYQLFTQGGIMGGSVFALLVSIFVFFFGFLADQVASIRREFRRYK